MVSAIALNSTTFALTSSFDQVDGLINPGNPYLFPWLSGMASLYEKYRFVSLEFILVSANPATHAGSVFMAIDVDPVDPLPVSTQELMANANSVTSTVWQSCSLKVDVARANEGIPWRYTNTRNGSQQAEPRTTYIGQLLIGSAGTSATPSTFNLEIAYEIDLSVEQMMTTSQQIVTGPLFHDATTDTMFPSSLGAGTGRLTTVVAGSGRIPTFDVTAANATIGSAIPGDTPAIDLGFVQTGSLLSSFTAAAVGQTPLAMMQDSFPNMAVFSGLGSFLGQSFLVDNGVGATRGVAGTGLAGQTGAPGRSIINLTIQALLATYPGARYLVPVLQQAPQVPSAPGVYSLTYTS